MLKKILLMMAMSLALGMSGNAYAGSASNPCNPCSMKKHNPCSMNPCSMKKHNPCSMNPCSMKKHNPCSMNPCSMNPCSDAKINIRDNKFKNFQEAVDEGRRLWNDDENLGTAGVACLSCHADFQLLNLDKHQNFPHFVEMTGDVVTLDQMINYCLLNPMQGKTVEWNSREMTAFAAYYRAYRMKYLRANK